MMMNTTPTTTLSIIESTLGRASHSIDHKLERVAQQMNFRKDYHGVFAKLSRREVEVLECVLRGLTNFEIGEMLFISKLTVEQHRKNIKKKLGARSFVDLLQYGLAFDLI